MERDDRFVGRIRRRLEEQRRRVSGQRTRMRQTGLEDAETGGIGELSLYDQHPADLGSELAARQTDIGLMDNMDRLLEQIERALKRIDEGTYGTCERCGRPIPRERLEALPHASTCVECQEREEQAAGGGPAGGGPRGAGAAEGGPPGAGPAEGGPPGAGPAEGGPPGAGPTGGAPTGAGAAGTGPAGTRPAGSGPAGGGAPGARATGPGPAVHGPAGHGPGGAPLPRRGPTGRRPAEEAVLTPPFGRTHGDPTGGPNVAAYDAEDVWRDVASHGTSNTPSDEPEAETITDGHDTWLLGQ